MVGGKILKGTFLAINIPATKKLIPTKTAIEPTTKSFAVECLAQTIGQVINLAILCSKLADEFLSIFMPICFLFNKINLEKNGIKIRATTKLIINADITVTGTALINVPNIPETNNNGAKLRDAVKVADSIARLTFCVAS